jgi:exonuclease III
MQELSSLATAYDVDILCINETNFKPSQTLDFPGFQSFLFNRPLELAGRKKGGGVAILVKRGVQADDLGGSFIDGVEVQKVQVAITKARKITIVSVYCPPGKVMTDRVMAHVKQDKNLLICGDFNAKDPELGSTGQTNEAGRVLVRQIARMKLRLLSQGEHTFTTRGGRRETLDLFMATEDVARLAQGVQVLPDVGSDHLPIAISLKGGMTKSSYPEMRLDYNRMNEQRFCELLQLQCEKLDFTQIDSAEKIDQALKELEQCLAEAEGETIPRVKAGNLKAWKPTEDIVRAIKTRRRARRLWERFRTRETKRTYNSCSKLVKSLIERARAKRFEDRCNELSKLLKDKPRLFWKEFHALSSNNLSSNRRSYPPIETAGPTPAFTDESKAAAFATHLADKVWITPDDPTFCIETQDLVTRTLAANSNDFKHPVEQPRNDTAGRWSFYVAETIAVVKKLKTTAPGEDGMQNAILKKAPPIFWEKATALFNASMRLSHIPEKWKLAIVCMLPKEGKDPKTVKGYRPISLLNALAKIMERLVVRRIIGEMRARGVLPASQSAFLNKHSVEDHPFRLAQMAATGLLDQKTTIMVCLDVEGAFDRVWHQGLLYKMRLFGFPNCALAWISNFLDGRKFCVRVGNSHSVSRGISGGVPQGSPLSPILYVLYTADLVRELPREVTNGLFADDIALAKSDADEQAAATKLNQALEAVRKWFCKWRLKLNAAKSQALCINNKEGEPDQLKIGAENIEWCKEVKYLGVWFDRKLLWQKQLKTAATKAKARISAMHSVCRNRFGLPTEAAITVFKTYVRPILTYGCQAYLGITPNQWEKLEVVQRIALRMALRLPPWAENDEVLRLAKVDTIRARASSLAVDWLERAVNAENLVGTEAEHLLNRPMDDRVYRQGQRPPLAAMVSFATQAEDIPNR